MTVAPMHLFMQTQTHTHSSGIIIYCFAFDRRFVHVRLNVAKAFPNKLDMHYKLQNEQKKSEPTHSDCCHCQITTENATTAPAAFYKVEFYSQMVAQGGTKKANQC